MQEIYAEFLDTIIKNKKRLQKELEVKIENQDNCLFIKGPAEKEYEAIKVIEAINVGFSVERALLLKNEDIIFHKLNLKNMTKRKNWEEIRGRIIGTHGRTLKILNKLTDCAISLHNNTIGIIGDCEKVEEAIMGITALIRGSKQGKVYEKVEREKKRKRLREELSSRK